MTISESQPWISSPDLACAGHSVQLYENEDYLYELVGDFLADGIAGHEPTIVIATPEHRAGFQARVGDAPVTYLDARATLASFMDGDMPDAQRFVAHVGGALRIVTNGAERVRAYGEMVDLLWRDGNPEAALRLEEMWNDLANTYSFTLLCAYRMGNFYNERHSPHFEAICRRHTVVVPTESFTRIRGEHARGQEIAILQQRAGALQAEIKRRKELEKALREALALAQDSNRTKDEFLATLSHELRTPLTAILGWSRLLLLGGLDDGTAHLALETIERSGRTQALLIDDLLDLSRIVTGKLFLQTAAVDLAEVIDNAVQTIRLAAESKQIRLDVSGLHERVAQSVVITGDPTRLQQIVWNLLSNAVKFTDAGGRVAIALENDEQQARITVEDSGRGIAADFLPHVFEPFRQGDGAATRMHGGLGLGLAIVKYLAELHGGAVAASSPGEGGGATFIVTLPLKT